MSSAERKTREAANNRTKPPPAPSRKQGTTVKPKNPDVGNVKKDR